MHENENPVLPFLIYSMQKRLCAFLRCIPSLSENIFRGSNTRSGKITLLTIVTIASVLGVFVFSPFSSFNWARADNIETTVTVLNTPPTWDVLAEESAPSATSTPTNTGSVITWVGQATDSSNDQYYLIICKTGSPATARSNQTPLCNGGVANQWAVSSLTPSGTEASAATTTRNTFPFDQESNAWYAFICDANVSNPQCNATVSQGSNTTASPFVINHPPSFSAVSNDSPAIPGETVSWNVTASDADTIRGGDTVKLLVCKAADMASGACGAGGTWAESGFVASNPATSTAIGIPFQDRNYAAYVYVVDDNNFGATSAYQGSNSQFTITNVAPTIDASQVTLLNTTGLAENMELTVPNDKTTGFRVNFSVTDNNSCQNASSTNEISLAISNVYRSGVGQASCQASGDFNSNRCYPYASALSDFVCTQDGGSCSGSSDSTATWTCTFSLWYNADPTDTGAQYAAQNWLASVQVTDNNSAASTLTESTSGNELAMFLAFDVPQTSIAYGGLQPGQQNDPLSSATTTNLLALGNVGLDESLYGDTMCTNWTSADSCDITGANPATKIPVSNQRFAASAVAYSSATPLTGSSTPSTLLLNIPKTTATSSPQSRLTYWGIHIPNTITLAGDYRGQNTILAAQSDPGVW